MVESNDILGRKNEIKGFVAAAKLELAIKRCIDFCVDFNNQDDEDAILLSTSYYTILMEENKGVLTLDEILTLKQQIARRILRIIKGVTANYALAS